MPEPNDRVITGKRRNRMHLLRRFSPTRAAKQVWRQNKTRKRSGIFMPFRHIKLTKKIEKTKARLIMKV